MMLALLADTMLRRNIRIIFRPRPRQPGPSGFEASTGGSHHVGLCNAINRLWNTLVERERARGIDVPHAQRPTMASVASGEKFGLQGFITANAGNALDDPDTALCCIKDEDFDDGADLDETLVSHAINNPAFVSPGPFTPSRVQPRHSSPSLQPETLKTLEVALPK